jgi:hypothetical protein
MENGLPYRTIPGRPLNNQAPDRRKNRTRFVLCSQDVLIVGGNAAWPKRGRLPGSALTVAPA